MNATTGEKIRALEIVLSNLKFDTQTAQVLKVHLEHERRRLDLLVENFVAET